MEIYARPPLPLYLVIHHRVTSMNTIIIVKEMQT